MPSPDSKNPRVYSGIINLRIVSCLCVSLLAQNVGRVQKQTEAKSAADLRARIEASPKLPFRGVPFTAQAPNVGWASGLVSWVAIDSKGLIYEIQRGDRADPVLLLDEAGKLLGA